MKLLIKKKYINRHNILSVLYEEFVKYDHPGKEPYDALIKFEKLASRAKVTNEELKKELHFLSTETELFDEEANYVSYYGITQQGRAAFVDDKYIKLGKDELWSDVKNYIAVAALIISIFTILWNIHNGSEISKLKNRIEVLEKK